MSFNVWFGQTLSKLNIRQFIGKWRVLLYRQLEHGKYIIMLLAIL